MDFEEVRRFWALALGLPGPQWMIIVALADLDDGNGAPASAIARRLDVNLAFVVTRSRLLEQKGFIRRSNDQVPVIKLHLNDMARAHLAEFKRQARNPPTTLSR